MKKNVINEVFNTLKEKYSEDINYSDDLIKEIIVNCASLSNSWLSKLDKRDDISFEINLYDKSDNIIDTLFGVKHNTIVLNLSEILIKHKECGKAELCCFYYDENGKRIVNSLGKIEIS